ncbi:MAG: cation transporter [Planctomycetota bacterium]|nr:MAG: cation transporter [Planctomycetota bacterium]
MNARASSPDCDQRHGPLARGAHGHSHGHAHDHGHGGHSHEHGEHDPSGASARSRRALGLCIALTLAMMAVEIVGGLWTDSLMLLSDAAHMASHAVALLVSWGAFHISALPRDSRSHFGLHRAEILAALANGVGLLAFTVWIAWEAFARFSSSAPVAGPQMTAIAALGLGVNLLTAWILHRAGAEDLNTRSAFLHMLGDTLSSVAIVIGGVVLWATGWQWIDPALSLLVAAVIVWWGFGLLRQALRILLEQTPEHIEPDRVRDAILAGVPAVRDVHDLHVWEITSGYVCLMAHLVVDDQPLADAERVQREVTALVERQFHIGHATLQLETQRD